MTGAAARPRKTVGAVLADCRASLTAAGIDSAALDARLLVAEAFAVPVETVIAWPERPVPDSGVALLTALTGRRAAREPMAHILGRREFWSLDFTVTSDVLVPRPDSETLVAAVLDQVSDRQRALSLLDLGTGSGCLLLALLSELPQARGTGVDCSAAALAVARRNAAALGLDRRAGFVLGDWTDGLTGPFDIVVGNPPYIPRGEIAGLDAEVRREPALALDGGDDGLAAYRRIVSGLRGRLADDGLIAFEIGRGQEAAVESLLRAAGFTPSARRADLAGIVRCILARPKPERDG